MRRALPSATACLLGAAVALPGIAAGRAAESCFATLAATRNFTLGLPRAALPTPDGRSVLFLRSGPRDTVLHLYRFDLASGTETELARPETAPEQLSVAEKARRERARMTLTGITDFQLSRDGTTVLATEADHLLRVTLADNRATPVAGAGWIAPRLSPDGRQVAVVRDDDLHVVTLATGRDQPLTTGGTDTLTRGLAEFAAAEEFDRADGAWWSPDSRTILYEAADSSGVEQHVIADPGHPERAPVTFRYPRAGTANARVRLGLVAAAGGPTRWIDWDGSAFPYLARVVWPEHGRLTLVVLNRAQTEERVLAVDPATGHASLLLSETDPAWINVAPVTARLAPTLPRWLPDGSGFLWAAERDDRWQLELHRANGRLDRVLTAASLPFLAVEDLDPAAGTVTVSANPDRLGSALYRIALRDGAVTPVATEPGLHAASFVPGGHRIFADAFNGADGSAATLVRSGDGRVLATLPSHAEAPAALPHIAFAQVGARHLDALIVRPTGFVAGRKYPVVLQVYAGPTVKTVQRAPRLFFEDQCLADRGFIVASIDGRGTPGRGHDWERAIEGDLIDVPLADQVDGLQALGARTPEMDLDRVGVTGWSFGGYFTAMATIRRPDIFKAGVAGAPVVDFGDYDTAYTERYLGRPQTDPDGYRKSDVLTYAGGLSRPLLVMHGLTDDNVYFENSYKLTQALLAAGKPYQLLLLPGTHQLPDPLIRTRVADARADFLDRHVR